ncbi:DUF1146 family protein [Salinibacillus xinjiangensis]|uniref:DUF1146 domain-containing protein n=1 Tax=Salinibacillus xinjiangensis TaxID=1229268 RepID=A0A6G1X5M3_9BACI|nr:DUF1146 family protein [Salinibacillus xinjiangensis]MRG86180.1 DUF1146 domain-containing protein [Salinibacillus xinjiangensis]
MTEAIGMSAFTGIISHIIFFVVTWKVLEGLRIEQFFKKGKVMEARILFILVCITIGATASNFFLDILSWSQDLVYLF